MKKGLIYIFPCSQYPMGYIGLDLGLKRELNFFGDYEMYRKALCQLYFREMYVVNLPYMKLNPNKKKDNDILYKWLVRVKRLKNLSNFLSDSKEQFYDKLCKTYT